MSWLTKLTGVQELINQQKLANNLLRILLDQNRENKKPKGPATKKYK